MDKSNEALNQTLYGAVASGDVSLMCRCIRAGADVNAKFQSSHVFGCSTSLLHLAVDSGRLQVLEILLQEGADITVTDEDGKTPLQCANEGDCKEMVRVIAEFEPKADRFIRDSRTPLHQAAQRNQLDVVKNLLDIGANVNAIDDSKKSPLHIAVMNHVAEIVVALIDAGAYVSGADIKGNTPLHYAAWSSGDNTTILQTLLDVGAVPDAQTTHGKTPLHNAALSGNTAGIKVLLNYGATVDLKDQFGWTPLYDAVGSSKLEVVKVLLDHGANVHNTDKDGWTPLHYAASTETVSIVELLISAGADIDVRDSNGFTPIHYAAKNGYAVTVKKLIDLGANIGTYTKDGKTPLYFAADHENKDAFWILLDHQAKLNEIQKKKQKPKPKMRVSRSDVPTLKLMYGFPTIDGYLNLGNLLEDRYKEVGPYLLGPENSASVLELYESQYPGNARKITNGIFIKWLQGSGKPVTWDTLVDCLEKFSISCIVKVVVDSFKEDKEPSM